MHEVWPEPTGQWPTLPAGKNAVVFVAGLLQHVFALAGFDVAFLQLVKGCNQIKLTIREYNIFDVAAVRMIKEVVRQQFSCLLNGCCDPAVSPA